MSVTPYKSTVAPVAAPSADEQTATRPMRVLIRRGPRNPDTDKSLRRFIKDHRDEIDRHIRNALRNPEATLNDDDRAQWVANDEGLYSWAKSWGWRG